MEPASLGTRQAAQNKNGGPAPGRRNRNHIVRARPSPDALTTARSEHRAQGQRPPRRGILALDLVRIHGVGRLVGDDLRAVVPVEPRLGLQAVCVEQRSEEHTSELQSLMRISYAVFCLKKKK